MDEGNERLDSSRLDLKGQSALYLFRHSLRNRFLNGCWGIGIARRMKLESFLVFLYLPHAVSHTMMRMQKMGRSGLSGEPVLIWSTKRNTPPTVGTSKALRSCACACVCVTVIHVSRLR